jgi:hypothetical protein
MEEYFENYDNLDTDTLQRLAGERGIEHIRDRVTLVNRLNSLDRVLDLPKEEYSNFEMDNLMWLAGNRGFDEEYLEFPQAISPTTQKELILKALERFEAGTLDDNDTLTRQGANIYAYAQRRYQRDRDTTRIIGKGHFGNYDTLDEETLNTLGLDRGLLEEEAEREGIISLLNRLDTAIDLTFEEYNNFDLPELLALLEMRGIDPDLYYDPLSGEYVSRLLILLSLRKYEKGIIPIDQDTLTPMGQERYIYAQKRYPYLRKEKPPTFLGTPPSDGELRAMNQEQLRRWLQSLSVNPGPEKSLLDTALRIRDLARSVMDIPGFTQEEWIDLVEGRLVQEPGTRDFLEERDLRKMTIPQLKTWLDSHGVNRSGVTRKDGLVQLVLSAQEQAQKAFRIPPRENIELGLALRKAIQTPHESALYISLVGDIPEEDAFWMGVRFNTYYHLENGLDVTPIDLILSSDDPEEAARKVLRAVTITMHEYDYLSFREKIDALWGIYSTRDNTRNIPGLPPIYTYSPNQIRETYPFLKDLSDVQIIVLLQRWRAPLPEPEENEEAKRALEEYTPAELVPIVKYLYRPSGDIRRGAPIEPYSPFQEFLRVPPNPLIPFILEWNEDNTEELAGRLGMIFPPQVETSEEKKKYFLDNVKDYADIFRRPDAVPVPPPLEDVPVDAATEILKKYSDDELFDAYDLILQTWTSRKDLLEKIVSTSKEGPKWSFRNRNCSNLQRLNVVTIEEPIPTDDPEDPILAYGTLSNYRCYQISELEDAFKEDLNIGFVFNVPDWVSPGTPVSYTPPDYREFPLESMRELRSFLRQNLQPIYQPLLTKIEQGLVLKNAINARMGIYRQEYSQMVPEDQALVQEYIFLLFIMGMYMRFWKGPGHPFPMEWVDGGGGEFCELGTRNENVAYIFGVRTRFLEVVGPQLETWLLSFPRVRYDFRSGTVSAGQETINFVIEEAQIGNFCLADASDHILSTSYFLALRLLNLTNEDFNTNLRNILETPDQPPFDPQVVTRTGHRDPFHQLRYDADV